MMDKNNKEKERKNTQNDVSRKAMQPQLLRHVRQMALAFALS
jgi:hypothetical protein